MYALTVAGSIASVAAVGVSALNQGNLSGGWLFSSLVAPICVMLVLIAYLGWRFTRTLRGITDSFRSEVTWLSDQIGSLEVKLQDERSNLDLAFSVYEQSLKVQKAAGSLGNGSQPHQSQDVQLGRIIKAACREMAIAYSARLGASARVCVKQVMERESEPGRAYVKAIARSTGLTEDDTKRWHAVDENTDFEVLFERRAEFWLCHDVQDRALNPDYKNTSPGERPYRSVLVWPVITRAASNDLQSEPRSLSIAAFLCLDAPEPHLFSKKRDAPIGAAMAAAMATAFDAHFATSQLN